MSFVELGAIGEFVAACAVLVTLIYLAIQTKQAKVATKASAHRDAMGLWVQMNLGFSNDRETRALIKKAMVDQAARDAFDPEEWHHLTLVSRTILLNAEEMFYQHQHGVIESEIWADFRSRMVDMLNLPAFKIYWIEEPMGFTQSFCRELIGHGAPVGGNPDISTAHRKSQVD